MSITNITDRERAQEAELKVLRAALWSIATTEADSNSAPDVMAHALDNIIGTAQGALRVTSTGAGTAAPLVK